MFHKRPSSTFLPSLKLSKTPVGFGGQQEIQNKSPKEKTTYKNYIKKPHKKLQ